MKKEIVRFAGETGFSGNISIYRRYDVILDESFGYRDMANNLRNNSETKFGIASGTKTFTAVGILKLVDKKKLTLSTNMTDLFKKDIGFIYPGATIRDLLVHASGIFDYYDEERIEDPDNFSVSVPWYKLETPGDYLRLFEGNRPKFKPGSRISYSNGGYVFLAIIIERLTGLCYREFMAREIFLPLGMSSTGFYAFNALPGNTAVGYIRNDSGCISNIYQLPLRGGGDGGLYTNSRDMAVFWMRLFNNECLSKDVLDEFKNAHVELFSSQKYGLGVYIGELGGSICYSAAGCDAGIGFNSTFVPESGLTINIFSNRTDGHEGLLKFIKEHGREILSI
ncbi:MAG: beta-lactamase family protein [Spirochaetales bacterium]|nr:beta-lactamase family protein [Spirochaetales bacterium]